MIEIDAQGKEFTIYVGKEQVKVTNVDYFQNISKMPYGMLNYSENELTEENQGFIAPPAYSATTKSGTVYMLGSIPEVPVQIKGSGS